MELTVERIVERTPERIRPGVHLALRTVVDAFEDRVPGLSAEMAFYLVLSLPPLLITVFTGVGLVGNLFDLDLVGAAAQRVDTIAGQFLTPSAADSFSEFLDRVTRRTDAGLGALLSFGFLVTVFTASRALRVTSIAIAIAYDIEHTRPGWKQALYSLGLTVALVLATMLLIPAFVLSSRLGRVLAEPLGLTAEVGVVFDLAYWPVAVAFAIGLLTSLYHVAVPWYTPWRRDVPGAILAACIGVLGSLGLRLYADRAIGGGSDSVFGFLAAPLVLLLWFYVMSFAVLIGAELNAEIEKIWPSLHDDREDDRDDGRLVPLVPPD